MAYQVILLIYVNLVHLVREMGISVHKVGVYRALCTTIAPLVIRTYLPNLILLETASNLRNQALRSSKEPSQW